MTPLVRSGVSAFLFIISFAATATRGFAADTVVQWDGAFYYRINEKSDKLSNGRAVHRLRYRGKSGDVVWATLSGVQQSDSTGESDRVPLANLVLEYDPSGGRGEWEVAESTDGAMGFEIKAPANGLVEFRVRATKPGVVEQFLVEYGGDTAGAKPLCFTANEIKGSIESAGMHMLYPLNVLRGNSTYEFEMWTDGYIPSISLTDPKGVTWGFTPIDSGPAYTHRRYLCAIEGKYELKLGSGESKYGKYTLRLWYPLPLQKKK